MELHLKYRPNCLEEVKGNADLLQILNKEVEKDSPAHSYMFTGPPGCGKTTLGRILANELGCKGNDFREVDSADFRGIDTIREMRKQSQFMPLEGDCKVWLLDEVHKLSNDAMNALLKALEEPPGHVYYILCTTDPQKLLLTVRDRCMQFQVKPLTDKDMMGLLRTVIKGEEESLVKKVYDQIIQDSQGRPRAALQILSQVLCADPDRRLEIAMQTAEEESKGIELFRALLQNTGWKKVSNILSGLKEQDPEGLRHLLLACCQSTLLKGENAQAAHVMEEMIEPFYNSKFPGLVFACYSIVCGNSDHDIPF